MTDPRIGLGVLLGLLAGVALLPPRGARREEPVPVRGALLSDADGTLEEIVVHYVPAAAGIVERTYRDLLRQLPAEVTVRVVCPDAEAFEDLRRRVGPVACRLSAVPVGHEITSWSRDRWLALQEEEEEGAAWLVTPREEEGQSIWPARAGDGRVAADLASALAARVRTWRAPLLFDGGDFVADERVVFVSPRVVRRNVGVTVRSSEELRRLLASWLGREAVLLPEAPDHHAGMYLMLVGEGTALVGDPSLARTLLAVARTPLPLDADFSAPTQASFDAVAEAVAARGYRVVRAPVVPLADGRTWITCLNVLLDETAAGRVVYLPVFENRPALNGAAEALWRSLGFEVRRVDCTDAHVHYGSLRCLVNVLRRRPLA